MHCHGNYAFHPNNHLSAHQSPTATVTKQPPPSPQFFYLRSRRGGITKNAVQIALF